MAVHTFNSTTLKDPESVVLEYSALKCVFCGCIVFVFWGVFLGFFVSACPLFCAHIEKNIYILFHLQKQHEKKLS